MNEWYFKVQVNTYVEYMTTDLTESINCVEKDHESSSWWVLSTISHRVNYKFSRDSEQLKDS